MDIYLGQTESSTELVDGGGGKINLNLRPNVIVLVSKSFVYGGASGALSSTFLSLAITQDDEEDEKYIRIGFQWHSNSDQMHTRIEMDKQRRRAP